MTVFEEDEPGERRKLILLIAILLVIAMGVIENSDYLSDRHPNRPKQMSICLLASAHPLMATFFATIAVVERGRIREDEKKFGVPASLAWLASLFLGIVFLRSGNWWVLAGTIVTCATSYWFSVRYLFEVMYGGMWY
jgi:hypothetical protein